MVRKLVIAFTMVFVISLTFVTNPNSSIAQVKGEVPGNTLGLKSDADLWRYIRTGNAGSTQMKDQLSAVMIQSEGIYVRWVELSCFLERARLQLQKELRPEKM